MRLYRAGGKVATLHQSAGQGFQTAHLFFRGALLIKIPDQTNAEGGLVLRRTVQMPAIELFLPTIPHADGTVGHAIAIADEEVVGEAVLHVALLAMVAIQCLQRARVHSGVMDDDVAPAAGFDGSGGNAFLHCGGKCRGAGRTGFGRNGEALTDVDFLFLTQAIAGGERGDGDLMAARDVAEGILGFDDVGGVRSGGASEARAEQREDELPPVTTKAGERSVGSILTQLVYPNQQAGRNGSRNFAPGLRRCRTRTRSI